MHRTITIAIAPERTAALLRQLETMDEVIGLAVDRGASLKPPGDVIMVHVLNRGVDDVLRHADDVDGGSPAMIVTNEVASIIDVANARAIEDDVDEAAWEEMLTGLRHQGQLSVNFLVLMALGGVIAAVGFVSGPVSQATAFVAASVIAPGFEPIAKVALGLVLRRADVARAGALATLAGYAALIAAACGTALVLRLFEHDMLDLFLRNEEAQHLASPDLAAGIISAAAAAAGIIMIATYRRSVIAGPLIGLALIPAMALAGVALAAGQPALAGAGLLRFGIDLALIVGFGWLVFSLKQRFEHSRAPSV